MHAVTTGAFRNGLRPGLERQSVHRFLVAHDGHLGKPEPFREPDIPVTPSARSGDMRPGDGGSPRRRRQNHVLAVTARADGGRDDSLRNGFPVDALAILGEHLVVAHPADPRDGLAKGLGAGFFHSVDVTVAVSAFRCVPVSFRSRQAMDAETVLPGDIRMALGAGGLRNPGGMGEDFMLFMAARAGEGGVRCSGDFFRLVMALRAVDPVGAVRMPDRDQRTENDPKGKRKNFPLHGIGGPNSFLPANGSMLGRAHPGIITIALSRSFCFRRSIGEDPVEGRRFPEIRIQRKDSRK
jgi:hypothetical protein